MNFFISAPVDLKTDLLKSACKDELKAGGLTEFYARNVAHRLHSISLEDIQKYFSEDVGEENNIPTVNKNLKSEERVLSHAPLAGYDKGFTTDSLKYLDLVCYRYLIK